MWIWWLSGRRFWEVRAPVLPKDNEVVSVAVRVRLHVFVAFYPLCSLVTLRFLAKRCVLLGVLLPW